MCGNGFYANNSKSTILYVKSSLLHFSSAKLKFYSCFGNPKLPKFDDLRLYSHFKILAWVPFQNLVPFGLPCSTGPILHQTSGQLYYSFTVANESINEPQLKRRALELRPNFGLIANFFGGKSSRTTVYICILGQWVLSFFFCNGIFESFFLGQNEVVYDRNHYFGFGPIKPKLADTFGWYDTETTF